MKARSWVAKWFADAAELAPYKRTHFKLDLNQVHLIIFLAITYVDFVFLRLIIYEVTHFSITFNDYFKCRSLLCLLNTQKNILTHCLSN